MPSKSIKNRFKDFEDVQRSRAGSQMGPKMDKKFKNDAFWTDLLNSVSSDGFEQRFMERKAVEDKLDSLLKDEGQVQVIQDLVNQLMDGLIFQSRKSSADASAAKSEGNRLYKKRQLKAALNCYQTAILKVPFSRERREKEEDMDLFASCLANRSAVLFELKKYEDSIEDIDDAIENGYQKSKIHVLLIRKVKALKALGKSRDADRVYEEVEKLLLSFDKKDIQKYIKELEEAMSMKERKEAPEVELAQMKSGNKLLPFASTFLEMGFDGVKGRSLKAVKDIAPEEVIIDEVAFVSILNESSLEKRCSHCLLELDLRFIPCTRCTIIRYCSCRCRGEAWSSWHEIECDFMKALAFFPMGHMALRVVGLTGLSEALNVMDEDPIPSKGWTKRTFTKNFRSFWSLSSFEPMTFNESVSFVSSAVFTMLLSRKLLPSAVSQVRLSSLLLQIMLKIRNNDDGLHEESVYYGSGLFVTHSLLNHSCHANGDVQEILGNRMKKITRKPIKAGKEATVCYGPAVGLYSYQQRQEFYRNAYHFDCVCDVCQLEAKGLSVCGVCGGGYRGAGFGGLLCSQRCFNWTLAYAAL